MPQDKLTSLQVLMASFTISSLGGLAALLRSHKDLSLRAVCAAMLYSGMMGIIIALLWYNVFSDKSNLYFLLGVSGLAGIGGTTVVDFIIQTIKNGGINISITQRTDPENGDENNGGS